MPYGQRASPEVVWATAVAQTIGAPSSGSSAQTVNATRAARGSSDSAGPYTPVTWTVSERPAGMATGGHSTTP